MFDKEKKIYIGKNIIKFTPLESKLLELLIENKGKVVTLDKIAKYLYLCELDRYLIENIRRIVGRIRKKTKNEFNIYTRYNKGYFIN